MDANGAIILKEVFLPQGFPEILPFNRNVAPRFPDLKDILPVYLGPDLLPVDHSPAGGAQDDQLLPFDLALLKVDYDVSAVAAFGHNGDAFGSFG
jgi:hypothetical protein